VGEEWEEKEEKEEKEGVWAVMISEMRMMMMKRSPQSDDNLWRVLVRSMHSHALGLTDSGTAALLVAAVVVVVVGIVRVERHRQRNVCQRNSHRK
jgi:predicted DNA repair protein MutK